MLYGIIFLALGGFFLAAPYEKIKATFPKAKSPKVIKVVGGIIFILGILILLLSLLV